MRKTNGSKLLLALLTASLAGSGLLGARAWRVMQERRESALWHEQELNYISQSVPAAVQVTPAATDDGATPEPEAFEEMEPIAFADMEGFALAANPLFPVDTAEPAPSASAQARRTAAPSPASTPSPAPTPTPRMVGRSIPSDVRYVMDFEQLSALNKDVRGWLIAEDTILNYPIVQGEDNDYYLKHLFSGAKNKTGAVFMDCGNSRYFTDLCVWLYAHNRRDDTMFACIPDYADQAFFDAHPTMYLLTPYEDYLVELFACVRGQLATAEQWHVKSFEGKGDFETYVEALRGQSLVTSDTQVLWGDQLLAMSTCTNQGREERYVLFGVLRPIVYADGAGKNVTQLELEARESYTKTAEIPGFGEAVYYAQNDPTWSGMVYEAGQSHSSRKLGSSGGGPAALAAALANLADDEQLSRLLVCPGSEYGFSLCTCSVNEYFCNNRHVQLRVDTLENLKRYLPVVMASFAAGNNLWGIQSRTGKSGTNADFFPYVANACSLDYYNSRDVLGMLTELRGGAVVVASTGGSRSPFTGGGHYVTIIAMDEAYLYILDPYCKEDYRDTDRGGVLEVLEPGVVRVKWENMDKLRLVEFHIFRQRAGYVPPGEG